MRSTVDPLAPFAGADGTGYRAAAADVPSPSSPTVKPIGSSIFVVYQQNGITLEFSRISDHRDTLSAEVTITSLGAGEIAWSRVNNLASVQGRNTLAKAAEETSPEAPWREVVDQSCRLVARHLRKGEPLVTLTGKVTSPTRELMPRLLYEGESTQIYADGDSGKSLTALTIAIAVAAGVSLPFGLKPVCAVPVVYLNWEAAGQDTHEERLSLISAGLGIDPPPILYKWMKRPLVDEAPGLTTEFAQRGVGLVIVDSKMFAVAGGDGAAFHEPITQFYNALRLFAPAATLVLNHVTNDAARNGGPARPFGGAFAFNGPRLIWEAKRDHDVEDATAIVFTCRKANNLPRKPEPFGLRFQPGDGTITVYPFNLAEAAPQAVGGASLGYRIRLALAAGDLAAPDIAENLGADEKSVRRTLERMRGKGSVVTIADTKPQRWGLADAR